MSPQPIEVEKDRLAWLRQNLLIRVERSAADGSRIAVWLVTGSAAVFLLALKAEAESSGVTLGPVLLGTLLAAVVAAGLGAAFGHVVGFLAVRDYDAGVNSTEDLVLAMASNSRSEIYKAQRAIDSGGHRRGIKYCLCAALVTHLVSAALLCAAGVMAIGAAT